MPDKQLFTFRTPVGVAAIVTAGNFPVAVPSWYLVPALAVRQRGRVEAGRVHAGHRRGVRAAVPARRRSRRACSTWCSPTARRRSKGSSGRSTRACVDKVGFTGSTDVGRRIGELCGPAPADRRASSSAGKNPLVVMPDADLDLAVEGALFSGFGTAGQRCTSLGTAIVHADVHDDFLARFDKAAARGARSAIRPQDVLYGPMITQRFCDRFEQWLELIRAASRASAARRAPGASPSATRAKGFVGDPDAGLFYHPTIVDGVTIDDDLYATETFGPIVAVASFDDVRRGDGAGERPRLRPVEQHLHARSAARVPVPRADLGRHGEREQLHVAAPRRTCRSAATARAATARGSPASGCSISSRAGRR